MIQFGEREALDQLELAPTTTRNSDLCSNFSKIDKFFSLSKRIVHFFPRVDTD